MKISSGSDILPYLEHIIFSHPIFEMKKENAIISVLSFVEADFQDYEINISTKGERAVNNRLRSAQDILKYSLFHIINKSNASTPKNFPSITFDYDLYNLYKMYQIIHDSLQGVRIDHNTCEINPKDKIIKFGVSSDAIITKIREWKELKKLQENANKVLENISPESASEIRKSLLPAFSKLYYDKKTQSLVYDKSENAVSKAYDLIVLNEPYLIYGPKLPSSLDLGPYKVQELYLFWRYLNAISLLHSLAYKFAIERELNCSNRASIIIFSKEELLEKIITNSGLSITVAMEIFKDLTYDPINVKWTEPQYQPLIPLSDDKIAISPLLIGSNNYERNYAVLVEKLTWRKDVQIILKASHEDDMISRIIEKTDGLGLNYNPRIKLKEGGNDISDIDLVIWTDESEYILLLSLKWFYGPDSVQEFSNHAIRYREANHQQRRIIDFATDNPSQVLQKCGIKNKSLDSIKFLPIIIYEKHMPAEQDREKDLPAAAINRFIKIQNQKVNNLFEVYRKIINEYNSYPSVGITVNESKIKFGEYTFIIPKMDVNSEGVHKFK